MRVGVAGIEAAGMRVMARLGSGVGGMEAAATGSGSGLISDGMRRQFEESGLLRPGR